MSSIATARDGAVGIITIDRRDRFNSLDVETARDLRRAGLLFARDPTIRAVILRGSGGIFCSGADLKYIRDGGAESDLAYLRPVEGRCAGSSGSSGSSEFLGRTPRLGGSSGSSGSSEFLGKTPHAAEEPRGTPRNRGTAYGAIFQQILEYLHATIAEIRRAPKAFIAAVDGVAAAGGFGLAMSCDLVVASERSWFEWAYAKTGLTGAESSTFFLPRLVGLRRALEMLMLNPRLDARTAREWGIVTRVVSEAGFDDDVLAMAGQIADGPTEAMGITKELMNGSAGMDRLDLHLDRELEQLVRIAGGSQFAEGLRAFFEKRTPVFHE